MQENEKDVKPSEQIVESTEQDIENPLKLDYTLETPEERNELVKKIIESSPPEKLTKRYLEILADYIIFAMTKEQKRSKQINTDNRMITINKRETSFTIRSWSVPTNFTVPASNASGRSVVLRITSTGLPKPGASS